MLKTEPGNVPPVLLDPAESARIRAVVPEAAALLESQGIWDGELETAIQDNFGAGTALRHAYFRITGGDRVQVLNDPGFPAARDFCPQPMRLAGLKVGSVVQASSAQALVTEPVSVCSPLGTQQTAVFLLNYPSIALNSDWTIPNANSIAFGASNSIASYVSEVSHGKATVSGQVYGPYTLDTNFTCFEDPLNIANAAVRAIGTSINLRIYQRLFFIVPPASDCSGGSRGVSSVGCWTLTLADGGSTQVSLSQASNSPGVTYNSSSSRFVITHEYGHGLGVSHASSLAYSGIPLGNLTDPGIHDEYGDVFSVMGNTRIAHFGAPHQDLLGWFDPGGVATIATTGTYHINPLESAANQVPKALKIQRPGTTRYLWVEFRQPTGVDGSLPSSAFGGVIIHYQDPPGQEGQRKTHLLDYHPATSTFNDAPLASGETWSDPYSPLKLTVGSASAAGIDVSVVLATSCSFTLGPGSGTTVPAGGGSGSISVTTSAGCAWTASSNSSWLTITSGLSGSGSGTVQFTASGNIGAQRSGIITIAGQTYTVTQNSGIPVCSYTLGPGSGASVSAGGGTGSISVTTTSGCGWTSGSDSAWLTITSGFSGSGSGAVQFSAAANSGGQRTGIITIASQNYTVDQAAVPCSYSIGPGTETNVPASGGSGSINVSTASTCGWSATSFSSWLTIISGVTGSGNGAVQFVAAANTGPQRAGLISVAGQTYTVNQAAGTCSYTLSPGSGSSVPAGGGSSTLTVTAPVGCGWTAVSNANWLIITSGSSGSGPGSVQYTVQANSDIQRIGTITVVSQTYTVTEAAGTVSLTPSNSLTLSQLVGGGTEWSTTLFITNLSNPSESFPLHFYDDNGVPKPMPMDTLGMVDTITGTLAPRQTQRYQTTAVGASVGAWALLTPATPSTSRLSGFAVFRQTVPSGNSTISSEAVVDFTPITESKYVLLYDNLAGFVTTVALANPDVLNTLTILVDIRDAQGNVLATDSITLPPLGHTSFILSDRFPATLNRSGSVRFASSPLGFTGLGLRFSPIQTFTSFRLLTSPDIQ